MQQRNRHGRLDLVGDFVHRVGRHDQELGAGQLKRSRAISEVFAGAIPFARVLHPLDQGEING